MISLLLVTLESSTFMITSPALMPAFSAAESFVHGFHQHAFLHTEKLGELVFGPSDSPTIPSIGFCMDI